MIHRDYIMRQVHQLAQVLARVMGLDSAGKQTEGSLWLSHAIEDVTGMGLDRLRNASQSELMEVCSRDGSLSAELAVALADILMEDARILETEVGEPAVRAVRGRALFLYSLARDAGGVLPMDVLSLLAD